MAIVWAIPYNLVILYCCILYCCFGETLMKCTNRAIWIKKKYYSRFDDYDNNNNTDDRWTVLSMATKYMACLSFTKKVDNANEHKTTRTTAKTAKIATTINTRVDLWVKSWKRCGLWNSSLWNREFLRWPWFWNPQFFLNVTKQNHGDSRGNCVNHNIGISRSVWKNYNPNKNSSMSSI